MYRIYLVEDDLPLGEVIRQKLESWGYEVMLAENFEDIPGEFSAFKPHLVLMDVALPKHNGFYLCGEIRRASSVPVVFISSSSDDMSVITAINMGGDDYIAKPVEPMVLEAKLRAILRRVYELGAASDTLEIGGALLSLGDCALSFDGKKAELTRNEFMILKALVENRGSIVSRDTLMLKLWRDNCYVEENTLTVNVARLRKKLGDMGLENVIITKPGSGYMVK